MTSRRSLAVEAPVGLSAKMMRPPFISARAIDTRCAAGRRRAGRGDGGCVAEPEARQQQASARAWRSTRGMPEYTAGTSTLSRARRRRAGCSSGRRSRRPRVAQARRARVAVQRRDVRAHEAVGAAGGAIEAAEGCSSAWICPEPEKNPRWRRTHARVDGEVDAAARGSRPRYIDEAARNAREPDQRVAVVGGAAAAWPLRARALADEVASSS